MTERPTKDRIIQLIKEKKYTHVSSNILAEDSDSNGRCGKFVRDDVIKLSHYLGKTLLPGLEKEGILTIEVENKRFRKYRVNYNMF